MSALRPILPIQFNDMVSQSASRLHGDGGGTWVSPQSSDSFKSAPVAFAETSPLKHELQQIWAQIEQWIFVRRLAKVIRHHTFSAN